MSRRRLRLLTAALPLLTLLVAVPAASTLGRQAASSTQYIALRLTADTLVVGRGGQIGARVEPQDRRPVLLQQRRAGRWVTVERDRQRSAERGVTFDWGPRRPGALSVRVVAPASAARPALERVVDGHELWVTARGGPAPEGRYLRARQGVSIRVRLQPDTRALRWSVASGRLPAGLDLSRGGVVSGAAEDARGRSTVVVRAVDGDGREGRAPVTVIVKPTPPPVIATDLPNGRTQQPYVAASALERARAGRWDVAGRLPAGLTLDEETGLVSGEPTTADATSLRLRFTEVTGRTAQVRDRIAIVDDGGVGWRTLATRDGVTCGVQVDDTAWCWGRNASGAVGDGTTIDRLNPARLPGRWRTLETAQGLTCGVRTDDTGWCWGRNGSGQTGTGAQGPVLEPTRLPGSWQEISLRRTESVYSTVCGLRTDATLWCWGPSSQGQVGDGVGGDERIVPRPSQVPGTWRSTPSGSGQTLCAVDTDDHGWCWGANEAGQVGNGEVIEEPLSRREGAAPYELPGTWRSLESVAQPGGFNTSTTCGIRLNGSGWCWGENGQGQVGDGTTQDVLRPARLEGTWRTLSTSTWAPTCGIQDDDSAWCWGPDRDDAVGDGDPPYPEREGDQLTPYRLPGSWATLVPGRTVCGTGPDGSGWCWGNDRADQVGDTDFGSRSTPYRLRGSWRSVASTNSAGTGTTCGIRSDGTAACWGGNEQGQTGTGSTERVLEPTAVPTTPPGGWAGLDVGDNGFGSDGATTCGVGADGSGWCWGENAEDGWLQGDPVRGGQVGNGTLLDQLVPYGLVGGVR